MVNKNVQLGKAYADLMPEEKENLVAVLVEVEDKTLFEVSQREYKCSTTS